jgi:hypothetical protein
MRENLEFDSDQKIWNGMTALEMRLAQCAEPNPENLD